MSVGPDTRAMVEDVWAGRFGPRARGDAARAWSALYGGLDLPDLAPGDPREWVAVTVASARIAILRFDGAAVEELAARLAARGDPDAGGWSTLLFAWCDVLAGRRVTRVAPDDALLSSAAARVEARVLDALDALGRDEVVPALASAREATRLAQAEGHLDAQYLAQLVLARARRANGRPHLAAHILSALAPAAPRAYAAWVSWERRMCGLATPDHPLDALVRAIAEGDSVATLGARAALLGRTRGFLDLTREAESLAAAVDPRASVEGSSSAAFLRGTSSSLPHRVEVSLAATHSPLAVVAVSFNEAPRRVLAPPAWLGSAIGEGQAGRTEDAIATLALSPDARLDLEELFKRVYGFAFKRHLHDGALRVLLTRVRQATEGVAVLERDGDVVQLRATRPFLVVDPRVHASVESAVLRALASTPATSARELAERAGVPLRTVQAELARLVDEGICRRQKAGRESAYQVEDTTFRASAPRAS